MHGDAAARFLSELGVEQLEPVVNNLSGRGAAIIERPVLHEETNIKCLKSGDRSKDAKSRKGTVNTHQNLDSLLLYWGLVIRGVADSHQCVNVKFL